MSRDTIRVMIDELQLVKKGDPISATQWNRIVAGLERIAAALNMGQAGVLPLSGQIVELDGDLADYNQDVDASVLVGDNSTSSGGDPWNDTAKNIKLQEHQNGCWLQGERHLAIRDFASGWNFIAPGVQVHCAKLDGVLSSGGLQTATVWQYLASGWSATSRSITVIDWLLGSGQTIASGKKVIVAQLLASRAFIAIAAECA